MDLLIGFSSRATVAIASALSLGVIRIVVGFERGQHAGHEAHHLLKGVKMGRPHRHHVFDPTTDFSLRGLGRGSKLHDKGSLGRQGDCGGSSLQVTSLRLPLRDIGAYRMRRNGSGTAAKG